MLLGLGQVQFQQVHISKTEIHHKIKLILDLHLVNTFMHVKVIIFIPIFIKIVQKLGFLMHSS